MTKDDCINIQLMFEGGYADVAGDPGGATNFGITQHTLSMLRNLPAFDNYPASVADLSRDQAAAIYGAVDWPQIHGDELPPAVACVLLNIAVNEGEGEAARILQAAVRVPVDGIIGPQTLRAVSTWTSAYMPTQTLVEELCARAAVRYAELYGVEGKFELGWMRRLFRLIALVLTTK